MMKKDAARKCRAVIRRYLTGTGKPAVAALVAAGDVELLIHMGREPAEFAIMGSPARFLESKEGKMIIRKVCPQCGSTNVICQGIAVWDEEQQEWVFDLQVDPEYCNDCDSFDIDDVEIDEEEMDGNA